MEQALYRKYRPKNFNETVGQEHITGLLKKAIKAGRISHAYLFTGPKGVGKTSIARILAHEVNNLPYSDESIHLDIIEIDAASNRRIDEIRDLRDKVRIAPTSAKYKIYIIDEVHMLTREAFNALLKTLEEPPAHCIFILATTEAHKLPETIISRTQRHEFKPVNKVQMSAHLSEIASKEQIEIDRQALDLLADYGEGSFRDSIGYLDQLSSQSKKITEKDVREVLGLPASNDVSELVAQIRAGELQAVAAKLTAIQGQGAGAAELAAAIAREIRELIISGQAQPGDTKLLKELVDVRSSSKPAEFLEVILFEAAAGRSLGTSNSKKPAASEAQNNHPKPSETTPVSRPKSPAASSKIPDQNPAEASSFSLDLWPQVIAKAKGQAASIYTALTLATPKFNEETLTLTFEFPLHQKKLEQAKNKTLVTDIIHEICGQKVQIECLVDKSLKAAPIAAETNSPLHSISNIFGSAEMVEI